VKTQAFATLYAEYGQEVVDKVTSYHLYHGGLSRYHKFRYFHEVLLGKHLSFEDEKNLGEQFARLVVDAVVAAPWVPGALEFLENHYKKMSFFIASGTPDEELKEITLRRKMDHYFVSIHGAPAMKEEIIRSICEKYNFNPDEVLMIGDSVTDYEGATKAGVHFVGRVYADNCFPNTVPCMKDYRDFQSFIS
jgi:phosphoglycolate phosphatase-like HAD superfamily hydrolase